MYVQFTFLNHILNLRLYVQKEHENSCKMLYNLIFNECQFLPYKFPSISVAYKLEIEAFVYIVYYNLSIVIDKAVFEN